MTREEQKARRIQDDHFLLGVLVSLQHIYLFDEETIAEELVRAVGAAGLLRVAKRENDLSLTNLRHTVRTVRARLR